MKKKQILENILKGVQPNNPMLSDEEVNEAQEEIKAIAGNFNEKEFIKESKKIAKKLLEHGKLPKQRIH